MKVGDVIKMLAHDYDMNEEIIVTWYGADDFIKWGSDGTSTRVDAAVWVRAVNDRRVEVNMEESSMTLWEAIHDCIIEFEEEAQQKTA